MKKILFIGIEKFFVKGILSNLNEDKRTLVKAYVAINAEEIIRIAKENPDLYAVIFMGYLAVDASEDPFRANVIVATELAKILSTDVIMIAATEHHNTDIELLNNGCSKRCSGEEIRKWLKTNV